MRALALVVLLILGCKHEETAAESVQRKAMELATAKGRAIVTRCALYFQSDEQCPSLEQLRLPSRDTTDPWGTLYRIVCPERINSPDNYGKAQDLTPFVQSAGPDAKFETSDDLTFRAD